MNCAIREIETVIEHTKETFKLDGNKILAYRIEFILHSYLKQAVYHATAWKPSPQIPGDLHTLHSIPLCSLPTLPAEPAAGEGCCKSLEECSKLPWDQCSKPPPYPSLVTAHADMALLVVPAWCFGLILVAVTSPTQWKSKCALLVRLRVGEMSPQEPLRFVSALHTQQSSLHWKLDPLWPQPLWHCAETKVPLVSCGAQMPKAELIPICREWGTGVRELGNLQGWKRLKNQLIVSFNTTRSED